MNNLSLLNTFSYCILILYAYKDLLATFILYIYTLGCIWLVVLGAALSHTWSFLINFINGYMQLNPERYTLCFVLEWFTPC